MQILHNTYNNSFKKMELIWFKDFMSLAKHKNFCHAAGAQNITQPAFSRRIQALEN
jgi:LysR family transcriptional regulator, hypochlorite-specific transcription factor HypT